MDDNSLKLPTRKNTEQMAFEVGRRPAPRFALIIGIDNYINCTKLRGAVNDAKAMKQFLLDVHGTPEDHIVTLYNEEAARDRIITAIEKMMRDDRIIKMDSIIIFYAGHGSELPAPPAWGLEGKTQCLLPQNYDKAAGIMPLPDRTIGSLIENLARCKGDNITVIFDCCYSASGTRRSDEEHEYVPRQVELNVEIKRELDRDIWLFRGGIFPGEFAFHGLRSHVLLAACGEKEKAHEHEGRGLFTTALLEALRKRAPPDVTYTDILEGINLERQTPHCEGLNRHRALFDAKAPAGRHVWYPVRKEDDKYVISAGLSHGVSPGVEITLYNSRKLRLGNTLVDDATPIDDFGTTITSSIADVQLAKVSRIGKVPLYVGNDSVLEETLLKLDENKTIAANFRIVGNIEEAKLHATMEGGDTAFKILDQRVKTLGLTDIPAKAIPTTLVQVLGGAAHFFWYLDLENRSGNPGLSRYVTVDFYHLHMEYDDFGTPFLIEDESRSFRDLNPTLDDSRVIDIVVEGRRFYGIKIKNKMPRDLYLNAFMFNYSSLSIVPWYLPSVAAGKLDAPLKKNGTLTVGYGPGGSAPLMFSLEKEQNLDVGYLKIFFSTRPFDMSDTEQLSPFLDRHPPWDRGWRIGGPNGPSTHARDIWFTFVIPVVQRQRMG